MHETAQGVELVSDIVEHPRIPDPVAGINALDSKLFRFKVGGATLTVALASGKGDTLLHHPERALAKVARHRVEAVETTLRLVQETPGAF